MAALNRSSEPPADRAEVLAPAAIAPLCTDAAGVAQMLDVSLRTVRRLDDAGRLPAALPLGRSKRWAIGEIEDWIAAGSPPRRQWTAMRRRSA